MTNRKLIHRGAEADLFLTQMAEWTAVLKLRVSKKYRRKDLDESIRRERTIRESMILSEARKAGVRTPTIFSVDSSDFSMYMSFIPGKLCRDDLDRMESNQRTVLFREIGRQVACLHSRGIVHGDLTTSNVVLSDEVSPFLIDFGLSSFSTANEDRAVDLHLFRRSVETSHSGQYRGAFKAMMKGYVDILGKKEAMAVSRKTNEIARRGRYFAIR